MNDNSNSSDILDQLKSLSIERVDDTAAPQKAAATVRPRRSFPVKSAVLALLLGAGATGVWYSGISQAEFAVKGRAVVAAAVPAEYLPESWRAAPEADAAARAAPSTPERLPERLTVSAEPKPVVAPAAAPSVVGSGYVVADRELVLFPDLGGRIARMDIDTGDAFAAGQVLAVLNSETAEADLAIARASLAAAEAEMAQTEASLKEARAAYARQDQLAARGSVPQTTVEAARFAVLRQESEARVAAQRIEIAQLEIDKIAETIARHTVRAPFAGIVVKRHLNAGDTAPSALSGRDGPGIATLIDPRALTIEVDVAEANLSRIFAGQTARVRLDAYPNRDVRAVVKTIAPKVSIQKGTVQVRLAFETLPDGVFANMAAKVTFDAPEHTAALSQKGR